MFSVTVPDSAPLTVNVTLSTLPADYDLRIYRSNGTSQVAASSNGGTTSETITRTYTAGTYYARVFGYQNANNATNCYTLKIQLGTASKEAGTEVITTVSDKLTVSPNPVVASANLSFKAAANGTAIITVIDQAGATVLSQLVATTAGINFKKLDVSKLASGMYFVKIKTGDKVEVTRIIVAK